MFSRIGPPPGSRRQGPSAKYWSGLRNIALPVTATSGPSTPEATTSRARAMIGLWARW